MPFAACTPLVSTMLAHDSIRHDSPRRARIARSGQGAHRASGLLWRRLRERKLRTELAIGVLDEVRHHLHISQYRHEVGIATPARNDMHVRVVGDASARDQSLIDADIEALRAKRGLASAHTYLRY